jgi:hypothetical protein
MSGADAWVARDMSPAVGAGAEAVLYSEVGVGGAYGAPGSTVPAGARPCSRKPTGDREPLKREAASDEVPDGLAVAAAFWVSARPGDCVRVEELRERKRVT